LAIFASSGDDLLTVCLTSRICCSTLIQLRLCF